jgi:prepilin-type N-terminal cleavage/methylation domain-containing protein
MKRENRTGFSDPSAFTLIELLIVVAIIAILAAIAVPNFLEAQVRSKVARVKTDMRSIATAMESYATDHGRYPERTQVQWIQYLTMLTTPVAYMTTTEILDPFWPPTDLPTPSNVPWVRNWIPTFRYFTYDGYWATQYMHRTWLRNGAIILSFGPCMMESGIEHYPYYYSNPDEWHDGQLSFLGTEPYALTDSIYDPTNGTRSRGSIARVVGDLQCPQQIGG